MPEHILLDLDGTLTDPAEGITRSMQHALAAFGVVVEDIAELRPFIGPPLRALFVEHHGMPEEQTEAFIEAYRERFITTGYKENQLFPGVHELLQALVAHGKKLYLATSKKQDEGLLVLDHFGLTPYFTFVGGGAPEGGRDEKAEVIDWIMAENGLEPENTIMAGDRHFDIEGAKQNGLKSVGVLYGYGSREELEAAGADYIAATVQDLQTLLLTI